MNSEKQIDESRQGEVLVLENVQLGDDKKGMYIETYGCQMNFNDSEIVASLADEQYATTDSEKDADIVLINTCSIRDKAEQTVRNRLNQLKNIKKKKKDVKVGVIGCMAERLKTKLFEEEKLVDIVVGPDAYRSLPELINEANTGQKAVNVFSFKRRNLWRN